MAEALSSARGRHDVNDDNCSCKYLLQKGIREEFVKDLCSGDFNEGVIQELNKLGMPTEEIEEIRDFVAKNNKTQSFYSENSRCTASPNTIGREAAEYLDRHFGGFLWEAIVEIVKKQPFDPILYLGNWLNHYADRVQREKKQREFEAELMERRKNCNIDVTPAPSYVDLLAAVDITGGSEEGEEEEVEGREYAESREENN